MIRKAVIPAAGFGTRFLPATKSSPKEMLPIVDTPVIQYVVEEAVASGITNIVMVIGRGKRAVEEHFDRNFELEGELERKGRSEELEAMRAISSMADIHFVWQKEMNGLGDAVYCARHHIGDEPFAVLLGDTILDSDTPVTGQLMKVYDRYQDSVVALEEVSWDRVSRYGVMDGHALEDGVMQVEDFVEKPDTKDAPSNLVIASRYVFRPEIFDCLSRTKRGKNNEIQLTDAMHMLLATRAMYGLQFEGQRFDAGNKLDYLKTNIAFALRHADLRGDVISHIKELAAEL
ncbi:MAG: UTP--glucose-1-phosphate uridylyltransferase GalU [Verrucomicrobia bacterium]|jgi:UTP--glucose-1-phosphate uridylyltransferase|nr:UTP--glucose-1-phosphate uridylyltransferase GalU [Verrucomicrobiota bacterium]